jgi:hypothetical protein
MPARRSSRGKDERRVPTPPTVRVEQSGEDLHRLGEVLKTRAEDVLKLTVSRTAGPDHDVDTVVQESFERICNGSTIAVARWIAGEGIEVAVEAGR